MSRTLKELKLETEQLTKELESINARVAKNLDDLYGSEEPDIEKLDQATMALEKAGKAQQLLESTGATSSEDLISTVKQLVEEVKMHAAKAEFSFPPE